ncbi:MAG: hypothetical protein Q7R97_04100 [Candidatus Daviesbacteria bacterium]|nr:hypothetical protein [Candidatus Daviesbacteria bacterium]
MNNRDKIHNEAIEDLNKTYEQLLTDIHEELLHETRPQVDNIKHALKRIASFFTKKELESAKVQRLMNRFTVTVGVFTIVNVVVYLLSLFYKP